MKLTPFEKDKLLVAMAAEVARKRLSRGVKLNAPGTVALISDFVVEGARDGRAIAELTEAATRLVRADQVMDGIAAMIGDIEVEATFPYGTRIVTVLEPIRGGGSVGGLVPGEVVTEAGDITMNVHRAIIELEVENIGDRPIQVGSHYHFAEANPALRFDRAAARGKRLDIVPGATESFAPGESRTIRLIDLVGTKQVVGFRGEVMGALDT